MTDELTENIKHLILSLYQQGVRHVVISPGSRTTPIALLFAEFAAHQANDFKLHVAVDERSAAFFGLGLAKTTELPVALLATSGTATINYAPAMAEAAISHIPLIALTTDRPEELQGIGAPQTVPQNNLYGESVKAMQNITLQSTSGDTTAYIDYRIQHLVQTALSAPAGPIQINLPLRKPLMPKLNTAWPKVEHLSITVAEQNVILSDAVKHLLAGNVMFLAGPAEHTAYVERLITLAKVYQIPILADVLSHVRPAANAIVGIDSLIETGVVAQLPVPQVIVRFGGTPVSAKVLQWIKAEHIKVIHVGQNFFQHDHSRMAQTAMNVSELAFLDAFAQLNVIHDASFLQAWLATQVEIKGIQKPELSDLGVVYAMDELPADAQLFIANSMPIRDYDNYWMPEHKVVTWANRGANGIDGTISTAVGMAMQAKNNWLAIGDLALYHDMNGLMIAKHQNVNLTILVTNNNGGGIFSFLPQAQADEYFETLFGTGQNLSVAKIADLYEAKYVQIHNLTELQQAVKTPANGLTLLEVVTNRTTNLAQHQHLLADLEVKNFETNQLD